MSNFQQELQRSILINRKLFEEPALVSKVPRNYFSHANFSHSFFRTCRRAASS